MSEKRFRSVAVWPSGTYDSLSNVTDDHHCTKEEAQGVCNLLERNGQVHEGKTIRPIVAFVEEL